MIERSDVERLMARQGGAAPVLSLYLDLSTGPDHRRPGTAFLQRERARIRDRGQAEALERAERWLETVEPSARGAAVFAEVGGGRVDGFALPVPVECGLAVADRPLVAVLVEVLESAGTAAVAIVDRENLRLLAFRMGRVLTDRELHPEPFAPREHVRLGGHAETGYQRHKAEEKRHFHRAFAVASEELDAQAAPDAWLLLGTEENVASFREFLPEPIRARVAGTGPGIPAETTGSVWARVEPVLRELRERRVRGTLRALRERVRGDYLATAGFPHVLFALQEGKVDTLVLGAGAEVEGSRCTLCGYVLASRAPTCPYDGAPTEPGTRVVEETVRMAESRGARIEFVPPEEMADLGGVGALLRF